MKQETASVDIPPATCPAPMMQEAALVVGTLPPSVCPATIPLLVDYQVCTAFTPQQMQLLQQSQLAAAEAAGPHIITYAVVPQLVATQGGSKSLPPRKRAKKEKEHEKKDKHNKKEEKDKKTAKKEKKEKKSEMEQRELSHVDYSAVVISVCEPLDGFQYQLPSAPAGPLARKIEMEELHKAVYHEIPPAVDAVEVRPFQRPVHYLRYTPAGEDEGLLDTVDYDMDTEDEEWIAQYNKDREKGTLPMSDENLEFVVDRLEKFAFLKGGVEATEVPDEEDVVCSVCFDGVSDDTNQIVFCDGCGIAVHQDCYSIRCIPQGPWKCQRCQAPNKHAVTCALCFRGGGALMRTTDHRWVHVHCAIWTDETIVDTEPGSLRIEEIDISKVRRSTLSQVCTLCGKAGVCTKCSQRGCKTRMHLSCAQEHHLQINGAPHFTLYCATHRPPTSKVTEAPKATTEVPVADSGTTPTASMATNAPFLGLTLKEVRSKIRTPSQLVDALWPYWRQKRQERNNSPLLRRLEPSIVAVMRRTISDDLAPNDAEAFMRLRAMRQQMERARLLLTIVWDREKQKQLLLNQYTRIVDEVALTPLSKKLLLMVSRLRELDKHRLFEWDCSDTPSIPSMERHVLANEYTDASKFLADLTEMCTVAQRLSATKSLLYTAAKHMQKCGTAALAQISGGPAARDEDVKPAKRRKATTSRASRKKAKSAGTATPPSKRRRVAGRSLARPQRKQREAEAEAEADSEAGMQAEERVEVQVEAVGARQLKRVRRADVEEVVSPLFPPPVTSPSSPSIVPPAALTPPPPDEVADNSDVEGENEKDGKHTAKEENGEKKELKEIARNDKERKCKTVEYQEAEGEQEEDAFKQKDKNKKEKVGKKKQKETDEKETQAEVVQKIEAEEAEEVEEVEVEEIDDQECDEVKKKEEEKEEEEEEEEEEEKEKEKETVTEKDTEKEKEKEKEKKEQPVKVKEKNQEKGEERGQCEQKEGREDKIEQAAKKSGKARAGKEEKGKKESWAARRRKMGTDEALAMQIQAQSTLTRWLKHSGGSGVEERAKEGKELVEEDEKHNKEEEELERTRKRLLCSGSESESNVSEEDGNKKKEKGKGKSKVKQVGKGFKEKEKPPKKKGKTSKNKTTAQHEEEEKTSSEEEAKGKGKAKAKKGRKKEEDEQEDEDDEDEAKKEDDVDADEEEEEHEKPKPKKVAKRRPSASKRGSRRRRVR
eukprot:TRINITY_DN2211_c1_g1_i3.p1 TRINITY_DN2211_c1_g1~~TRINITY_DN2211_c1_g1_i3.p1  ORF type:complete len:1407 (-),score=455.89 TRINITY_DN2211_c1_g1_i3:68-3724(-)